jgi:N-acetylglucosamine kinase-like BadF-type ATPase
MTLLVGVDAGASHTAVAVADHSLRVVAREQGGPGAIRPGAAAEAAHRMVQLIERVMLGAGSAPPASALVVGAAGVGRESERLGLEQALRDSQIASKLQVTTDAAIALQSAFAGSAGVLMIAGTGAIAVGRGAKGGMQRVGGWGWQFGDEGGGYSLARAAVAAVTRSHDGRSPDTRLTAELLKARNLPSVEDLLVWARGATPDEIAALAPLVGKAASAGDPVAETLVETAAHELAHYVEALLARLPGSDIPLALAGGVLQPRSLVREKLTWLLSHRKPPVKVADVTVDPPLGALAFAARLLVA